MNILGISGTPRKGGNSEILLDTALEPFVEANWDVTRILLSEKTVQPCTGCDACVESQTCRIDDDMHAIYCAYEQCDAIIISAPAYWRNVPAQLKAVIDRPHVRKQKWRAQRQAGWRHGRRSGSGRRPGHGHQYHL